MRDMNNWRKTNKYGFATMQNRAAFREPLYTLDEIAEKLGLDGRRLRGQLGGYPRTESTPKVAQKSASSGKNLYRLSDFKKFLKNKETLQ